MQESEDSALLREYVEHGSEQAFATLVTRHLNKVYSVALRHTANPLSAEEITQAVFVILASKAGRLCLHPRLSGWLYETARLTSVTFLRAEIRRAQREQEAHMQNMLEENPPELWRQIAPLLDAALADLNAADRHAVVLRFFDGKSMKEIGAALGTGEDAAKMRISRALERLRRYFSKRNVQSTSSVLAGALTANAVQVAPVGLAKSVTAAALTKGSALSLSTLTLIKGAMKVMLWTKVQTAATVGTCLVLAAGATVFTVKAVSPRETGATANPARATADSARVAATPAAAPASSDTALLQGSWTGKEVGGRAAGSVSLTFQGANIEFHGAIPQEWYKATFSLREEAKPKQLVAVVTDCPAPQYVGKTSYAIYQLQNGTLTLVGNEPGDPSAPAGFDAPGSRKFVLTKK